MKKSFKFGKQWGRRVSNRDSTADDSSSSSSSSKKKIFLKKVKMSMRKNSKKGGDIEMMGSNGEKITFVTTADYLAQVEQGQACLQKVRKVSTEIQELREEALYGSAATRADAAKENQANMENLLENGNQQAMKAKSYLKQLQEAATMGESVADVRMRHNMLRAVTNQFQTDVEKYQAAQEQYKRDVTRKVERQIRIVQPEATTEEIQEAMEHGVESLYQQRILESGRKPSQTIRNKYHAIQERHNDLVALERSLEELKQMFLDFALLTEQQSALLDQIEFNLQETNDHIENGNKDVADAIWYQKLIRRKQAWVTVIVVIVVIVVVLALFA